MHACASVYRLQCAEQRCLPPLEVHRLLTMQVRDVLPCAHPRIPMARGAKIAAKSPLQPAGDARSRREGAISASRRLRSVHGGNLMGLGRFLDVWACFLSDDLHRSAQADMGAAPMSGRF